MPSFQGPVETRSAISGASDFTDSYSEGAANAEFGPGHPSLRLLESFWKALRNLTILDLKCKFDSTI